MRGKYFYQYKDPRDQGYSEFKLSKKDHKVLLLALELSWSLTYKYYISEEGMIIHRFTSKAGVLSVLLSIPGLVLFHGVHNSKRLFNEIKELCNQKKYGAFSRDFILAGDLKYVRIKEVMKPIR